MMAQGASFKFQFTHPRGVRLHFPDLPEYDTVSIHAPARGAMITFWLNMVKNCFNSRTREGCDEVEIETAAPYLFQFTHPRGVRSDSSSVSFDTLLFQFTHPRGVRFVLVVGGAGVLVSIHAPARGAIKPKS